MESVGYDMYCRLLEEEVQQLKGEEKIEYFETSIDLNISAYLPDFYVRNQEQRMELYKKIAAIQTQEEYYDMQEELEDRYGDLPKSAQTLLEMVLLKAEAHTLGITSISQKGTNVLVEFRPDAPLDPEHLTKLLAESRGRYLFTAGASPYLTIRVKKGEESQTLAYIKSLLNGIKE